MIALIDEVRSRPNAVFVRGYGYRSFGEIDERDGFHRGGFEIADQLFLKAGDTAQEIILKPNVVTGRPPELVLGQNYWGGMVTNARFIGGIIDALQRRGESNITVAEGGLGTGTSCYEGHGYFSMLTEEVPEQEGCDTSTGIGLTLGVPTREQRGARLAWMHRYRFDDYREDELTWIPVRDGVVHREFPIVAPVRKPRTALINVPTLKTHNLGVVTLCCKGLQGMVAAGHKHFCHYFSRFDTPGRHPSDLSHFQPNFRERVMEEYLRHVEMGLPFWDSNPDGICDIGRFELWGQRTADMISAFTPFQEHFLLNVVEGIIGRDGTAFNQGHDVPVGLVVAGINPVHVDAVAAFLMGHDPKYIPFLIIANERGLGENRIDRIETFSLPDLQPLSVEDLNPLRVSLPVYLHGDGKRPLLFNEDFFRREGIPFPA